MLSVMLFMMPLLGQALPWYKHKEGIRGRVYQMFSVPTINTIYTIQSKISSAAILTMSYVDKSIFQKKSIAIECEFKKIENHLRLEEQKAIDIIFRKNGLDQPTISFCFNILNDLKKFGQEYMSKSDPNVHHDKTISAELYAILTACLKRNNINPGSINIIDKRDDEALQKEVFEDAIAMAPYHNWSVRDNQLVIHEGQPHFYGFIALLPKIKKVSSIDEQEAILAHECEHIKEQHSTTCGVIKSCLYRLTDAYNEEQLLNSPEWHNLILIHEQEAEVFPSLRDANSASFIRKVRAEHHYTGMLYEGHYNTLSNIDETWKQYIWLKKHIKES
jgi:hypothetical protein